MINPYQLRHEVVEPVLVQLHGAGLPEPSLDATALLMGTFAQEGTYRGDTCLRQVGGGPALGPCQMEPRTHDDHYKTWLLRRRPEVVDELIRLAGNAWIHKNRHTFPDARTMVWNLRYAFAMARVHYFRVREDLPAWGDLAAQGGYWKRYYNTKAGAGTVAEYVKAASGIFSKWDKP